MLKTGIYRAILPVVRGFGRHRFFGSPLVTRLLWDTAPRDAMMLASCPSESFVVAAGDQVIGQWLFKHREPFDFSKLERVVEMLGQQRMRLLLDIGANIGTICIPAVNRGLFERAIAFEPEPRNFSLLRANAELNRVADRITTHNIALGEKNDEILSFELSKGNHGDHRARYGNCNSDFGPETIQVPSQTLDRILDDIDLGSTLLWMDTQGFEGYVLAGAARTLQRKLPLVTEFWPGGLASSGSMGRFRGALQLAGYSSFCDLSEKEIAMRPFSLAALDALAQRLGTDGGQTDLLFI
ncbi:FkbM family methyltransferase [Variovorax sp. dw_954]|uniref:FkbM family methyltransferase n=1 Tax=Variovorax sp. dw_954 TaxID=2720078 RepID=UPI001BD64C42|nr:FkbM family methyltransferase [Variovorax sp. dw_954]